MKILLLKMKITASFLLNSFLVCFTLIMINADDENANSAVDNEKLTESPYKAFNLKSEKYSQTGVTSYNKSFDTSIENSLKNNSRVKRQSLKTWPIFKSESSSDIENLKSWYKEVIEEGLKQNNETALVNESCNDPRKYNISGVSGYCNFSTKVWNMCGAYIKTLKLYDPMEQDRTYLKRKLECIPELTNEECYAITMSNTPFVQRYLCDLARGVREPYKVLTGLLFSGLRKLYAFPQYRVINVTSYTSFYGDYEIFNSKVFYFKTFKFAIPILNTNTSTEKNPNETMFTILPTSTGYGVNISEFDYLDHLKAQIMITPFEAFETSGKIENGILEIFFSDHQKLLDSCTNALCDLNITQFAFSDDPKSEIMTTPYETFETTKKIEDGESKTSSPSRREITALSGDALRMFGKQYMVVAMIFGLFFLQNVLT